MNRRTPRWLSAMLAAAWLLGPTVTAPAQSEQPQSLDEQLLEELGSDPLDADVDRELFGPEATPAAERPEGGAVSNLWRAIRYGVTGRAICPSVRASDRRMCWSLCGSQRLRAQRPQS